ncbi:P-loop NTPase fold protein [Albimonas pacifica]|uniref:KAP family P-loop domain-containing protein n=1 Tax=Albimonas pacifica TaxID=1114924 RepID=A0A1I3P3T0_9RHOB|nr:P-loop NTPase fold protein [Albimonas pacifica]SFJ15997.1 KAP family P-loop domain-containing protein [Albimonas pacifica]
MASPPQPEPEEILRAAVERPGEGTLGDLALQVDRVLGVLEKLDEAELRRSYATLARIVGGADKGEAPDEGGSPLRALSAVLERMRMAPARRPPPARSSSEPTAEAPRAPRKAPRAKTAAPRETRETAPSETPPETTKAAAPPDTGRSAGAPETSGSAAGPETSGSAAAPETGAADAPPAIDLDLWSDLRAKLHDALGVGDLRVAGRQLVMLGTLLDLAEESPAADARTLARLRRERDAAAEALAAAEAEAEFPNRAQPDPAADPPPDPRVRLLDAPGRAVALRDLAEARAGEGEPLLAPPALDLLERASRLAEALELPAPGAPDRSLLVVTPAALLAALLAGEREGGAVAGRLREWIAGRPGAEAALARATRAPEPPRRGGEAVADAATRALLARAAALAGEVRGASTAPGRGVLLAALCLTPGGRQAFLDLGLGGDDPQGFLAELATVHIDLQLAVDVAHDRTDWARWLEAHPLPDPDTLLDGLRLRQPLRLSVPDYAADDVARRRGTTGSMLEGDRLGVAADARALADLICLEAARPPLAIGLFGPWGSGKSTFMRMIEEAAEANRETARRMREGGETPPFVESVAHVWFNAWHYLDANLWASLVSHIFRELHRLSQGLSAEEAARMDYLVRKLASAAQAETAAREGVRTADASVKRARRRVAAADRLRACLRRKLAEAAPRALDELLAEETRRGLAALQAAGVSAPLQSVEQLRDLRRELSGLGGRLRLTGAAILRGGARTWGALALAAAALAAGGLGAAWLGQGGAGAPAWLAAFLAEASGWLGVTGALAAAVLPHLRRANAAMDALAAAEEEARARLAEAEAERRRLEADLARLEAERLRAQDDLDARRRERERLEAMRRGEQPAELLAQFIEERARAEGYRKHLGLLSQIRADFELMADLLAPRTPAVRADAAKRIEADPAALPHIGRIVLYIDDLDRCRDEQVVEVLEAIHLLLAFDLFVVVVGVDARWVEGALTRFYAQQLSPGETADGRPSVADYLEKIFQIPFRLRPMELGEGGGYSRLVAELVGPVQETGTGLADAMPDAPAPGPAGPAPAPAEDEGPAPLPAIDLSAVWPAEETPAQVLERVTLTRPELEAIEALGPLVGRSPRTAKRFVNLYRLLRSRRRGEELEAFLEGQQGHAAPFRGALFWLALETGLDARQSDLLRDALSGDLVWSWNDLVQARSSALHDVLDDAGPLADARIALRRRKAFWDSIEGLEREGVLVEGFQTLDALWPDARAEIVAEASRYSFRFGGAF